MNKKINVDKVYLINLERRKDRLDHFFNECKIENIDISNIEVFKAIDAKIYDLKKNEIDMFDEKNFDIKISFIKACICNQLSHYYVLMDMVKNKYKKCIIFQDDVRFRKNFVNDVNKVIDMHPKNAEIVWIGLHNKCYGSYFEDYPINDTSIEKNYVKEKINDYICKYKDNINPCSLAYFITNDGAKKYIKHIRQNKFLYATDVNYNEYLKSNGIMYGSYDVLCTGNSNFKSDVFELDDNAISRDMLELLEL